MKIGYTAVSPASRLSDIRSGKGSNILAPDGIDWDSLEIIFTCEGGKGLETDLHYHFRDLRVTGEWFTLDPAVVSREIKMAVAEIARRKDGLASAAPRLKSPGVVARGREYMAQVQADTPRADSAGMPQSAPESMVDVLVDAAPSHFRLFEAWVAAGFTEDQAISMLSRLWRNSK